MLLYSFIFLLSLFLLLSNQIFCLNFLWFVWVIYLSHHTQQKIDTYENIIEKDWSAKTTTLEEIVSYIKKKLGDSAVVTFDREIASIANCHCGEIKDLYLPVHKLTGAILTCPKCGNQMSFDSFHIIKGDEDFLNKTPYEIGIPLLHIIGGKVGINTTYYEFSGDEKEIFDGLEEEQWQQEKDD